MDNNKFKLIIKIIFSFIIVPFILFFAIGTILCILQNNTIYENWSQGKSYYLTDLIQFYKQKSQLQILSIVLIVTFSFLMFVILNLKKIKSYKDWFKKDVKDEKYTEWFYNEFNNKGDKNKLRKLFFNEKPNWILSYSKRFKRFLVNNLDSHALVLGIAGSGKTEKVVIPNIYYNCHLSEENKPNFVVNDPKGDILSKTYGWLKDNDYDVYIFNLADANESVMWNPLKKVWDSLHNVNSNELTIKNYDNMISNTNNIVENLNWGEIDPKNKMWVDNAKGLLKTIISFYAMYSTENDDFKLSDFNFANIKKFCDSEAIINGAWKQVSRANAYKNSYWNDLNTEITTWANIPRETLGGIITNISSVLNCFVNDANIKTITSNNTLEIDKIVNNEAKPYAIFIKYADHKDESKYIIPVLITQIYQAAIDKANSNKNGKLKRNLQFIIEEYFSLNQINNLGTWMSISRSRRIYFLVVIQDFSQLEKNKIDGALIKSQSRLIYFLDTNNQKTLEDLSKMLGVKKELKNTYNNGEIKSSSDSETSFMSVSQLKFKNPNAMIVLTGSLKPLLLNPLMAWQWLKTEYEYEPILNENNFERNEQFDFKALKKNSFNKSIVLKAKKKINNSEKNEETNNVINAKVLSQQYDTKELAPELQQINVKVIQKQKE